MSTGVPTAAKGGACRRAQKGGSARNEKWELQENNTRTHPHTHTPTPTPTNTHTHKNTHTSVSFKDYGKP